MKTAKISTKATITDMQSGMDGKYPINKLTNSVSFKRMSVSETSGANDSGSRYLQDVDTDLTNIFLALQGRIRFGDSGRGENISGEIVTFSTSTANTEVVVPHTLDSIPTGRIVLSQNKAGSLYSSATAWTADNIYVKSDIASVTFKIFLLK